MLKKILIAFLLSSVVAQYNKPIIPKPPIGIHIFNNQKNIDCLANTIYLEAGNQPDQGKMAIAFVVFNRVQDHNYTLSPCEIIKQSHQFSWKRKYDKNIPAYQTSLRISKDMLANDYKDFTDHATFFFADWGILPNWLKKKRKTIKIKNHTFYAQPNRSY